MLFHYSGGEETETFLLKTEKSLLKTETEAERQRDCERDRGRDTLVSGKDKDKRQLLNDGDTQLETPSLETDAGAA